MKKLFLACSAVAATLVGFTACSSDETLVDPSGDGNVTLTVSLPESGPSTRAFSDGLTATDLTYAVYLKDSETMVKTQKISNAFTTRQASITLDLVKGKSYDIIFWADNANGGYTFDASTKSVSVDYTAAVTSSDQHDAFFNHLSLTVTGPSQENVILYRPFAQINLGTTADDLAAALGANGYANLTQALSVKTKMPDTLNLLTGETSGETDIVYTAAAPPTGERFPVSGYEYVGMNYLLVSNSDQPTLIDCSFAFPGSDIPALEVNNVPVQRNYRTNIFGKLFTASSDIHILISPDYNNPDFNVPDWLDEAGTLPAEKNGVYEITTAAELAAVSKAVQDGTTFEGKVIKIMNDIDLLGRNWTPIGMSKVSDSYQEGTVFANKLFMGSIDGQDHTISNLVVNKFICGGLGLVGQMRADGSYIKNLNIVSADIANNQYTDLRWSGALVGYINGEGDNGVTIENCSVKNVHIGKDFDAPNYANGGLIGYISSCNVTVKNCKVEDAIICNIGSYCNGALIGKVYMGKTINIEGCSTKDVLTYNSLEGKTPEAALDWSYGMGNGWLIGNIFNHNDGASLRINITNCNWNGAADWDNINGANGESLLEAAQNVMGKCFPYIGSYDRYQTQKSVITVDGETVFSNGSIAN